MQKNPMDQHNTRYTVESNLPGRDEYAGNQSIAYLKRQRLHQLLETAMTYPLVAVIAGAGYGKTRAVYSFLQEYNAHTTWLQLSERDNIKSRFWESYSGMFSLSWPDVGAQLMEIGFPDTEETFIKYCMLINEFNDKSKKYVHVFDDVHLIYDPDVLSLYKRVEDKIVPNTTVILISRTIPDINLFGMLMHENAFIITEDMLCFSEEEIAEYFRQLAISATRQDIKNIYDDTQGWAFAVNLIGRSLIKEQKYKRYALEAMKKNILKFIETEISQSVSEPLRRFLLCLSLIDRLVVSLVNVLADNNLLIKEMELLNAFIRYDFYTDTYMIHHLFLEYLRQNQYLLTDEEKKETYQKAGDWCEENNYRMDAVSYWEKSGDYNSIIQTIASSGIYTPADVARNFLEIIENAPVDVKAEHPRYCAAHVKLKFNLGQFNEAFALAERYVKDYESRPKSTGRSLALASIYAYWAGVRLYMSTYDDVYDFDIYFKKMREYFDENPYKVEGNYKQLSIGVWALPVRTTRPGAFEEYINTITRAAPDAYHVFGGQLDSYKDLLWSELLFCRGEFDEAEQYLKSLYYSLDSHDQYFVVLRVLIYMMKIALSRGDLAAATGSMRKIESFYDNMNCTETCDAASCLYYLSLKQAKLSPEWLKADLIPSSNLSSVETFANRAKMLYHYQTHQYKALLAFIEAAQELRTVLFSRIEMTILKALSFYQLKRYKDAVAALTEAYELAESNKISVLFTQFGKDMRTLTSAALKDSKCRIPKEWLEYTNRKSSIYAKRRDQMIKEFQATDLKTDISLTEREIAILKDLAYGLSKAEIAIHLKISVNTVKTSINIIYDKLSATCLAEAIHIAAKKNII